MCIEARKLKGAMRGRGTEVWELGRRIPCWENEQVNLGGRKLWELWVEEMEYG